MNDRFFFFVIPLVVLVTSCISRHDEYTSFKPIENTGWDYSQPVVFNPVECDSTIPYDMFITVRHTDNYAYSNIWLEVSYEKIPGGAEVDTVEITLADDFGNWLGRGSGVLTQTECNVARRFIPRDSSTVKVRHIMRVDTLADIDLVGIRLTPSYSGEAKR